MRRLVLGAAALVGLVAAESTASAQPNRNVIRNSGNGANNTIIAKNGGGIPLYAPTPGPAAYAPAGYAPGGLAPVGYDAGYAPAYSPPAYTPGSYAPAYGGFNRNFISDSGNGVGNTIVAQNGGFGYGGHFPGGGIFPGGVNINVVTNSGNGANNTIFAGNGRPGGLNLNIITNSGNGIGNTIIGRNR
jgi:hypothetical protein